MKNRTSNPFIGVKTVFDCARYFVVIISFWLFFSCSQPDYGQLLFIGTYTNTGSEGIYSCLFNPETGDISEPRLAAKTKNPSFLAIDKTGKYLYAVNETGKFNNKPTGAVSTFSVDLKTGKLSLLDQISTMGAHPAHLSLDKTGNFVMVANYGGGNFAVFPLHNRIQPRNHTAFVQHTGSGANRKRQEAPHAHFISVSNDNKFVMVADLGIDKVMIYPFNATSGALDTANAVFAEMEPGSGPRHFTFDNTGRFLYVLNELTSNIAVFSFDNATAATQAIQTIPTLPAGFNEENTCAEILTSTDGRFVYASNRGHNSIVQFAINANTGTLTAIDWFATGGQTPRNFAIDPTEKWLLVANQNSDNITLFRINQVSGRLTQTNKAINVKTPVCITFVESN